MIHILTVHWHDDRWVKIQTDYFQKHIGGKYKTYAFLNGIDEEHHQLFDFVLTDEIECCKNSTNHAVKLNLLAQAASNVAHDDDILLFIDGDAIPINNVSEFAEKTLSSNDLAAVQRIENSGDIQPHPIFCIIRVKTWKKIQGDWKPGHLWKNGEGHMVTDTGGNLLSLIEEHNLQWAPLHRTNKHSPHPVLFGVYANIVYHHGAAFRGKVTRHDRLLLENQGSRLHRIYLKLRHNRRSNRGKILYTCLTPFFSFLIKNEKRRLEHNIERSNSSLSQNIYNQIISNPDFFKEL